MSNRVVGWVPCSAMAASHLSPQAYERLREELAWRTGEYRREISLAIERARELGDISENADYDAAKDEQGKSEARVRQIEQILKTAVVVEGTTGDVVEPGCLVELRYEGDDDAHDVPRRFDRGARRDLRRPLARLAARPGDPRRRRRARA